MRDFTVLLRVLRSGLLLVIGLLAWLSRELPAHAQARQYSEFERDIIAEYQRQHGGELDNAAEGKIVESIDIVTHEVFDHRDPMPDFVNVFHTTTRKFVIRRELLFEIGAPYVSQRVDETARNLRELRQLSLVLIVAFRGSASDRVRLVVITKDVWSLRLNWDIQAGSDGLYYLLLNPSEENLFGTHATIGGLFALELDTYSAGLVVSHRRIFGTRLEGRASANIVFNRESGDAEGSFGAFSFGLPMYSLRRDWGFATTIQWIKDIYRRYVGADLYYYRIGRNEDQRVPWIYDRERIIGGYEFTRSWGRTYKYDLSLGIEADRRMYRVPAASGAQRQVTEQFVREELPVSDQRISPYLQLRSYTTKFLSTIEFETLGLQEDIRLGHDALVRIYPASSELGSTRDMIGIMSAVGESIPIGNGLIRTALASTIEYEKHDRHDASFEAALRFTSPRLGFGRLVFDGLLLNRYMNYLNRRYSLGGSTRLRGYPLGAFIGKSAVAANVEYRSPGFNVLSVQVGAAAFYDLGHAANSFDELSIKHSTGVGIRALFPQFDRTVFRADWGFPLSPGYSTFPGAFFFAFGQAFSLPGITSPSVTKAVLE